MDDTTRTQPNFMIIGMQKAGTSWLYKAISQHPDVWMSVPKELHFFNRTGNFEKGIAWYESHFAGRTTESAVGEATPNYLWNCPNQQEIADRGVIPNIAPLVHSYYPNLKLIISLRNPVDRAVSAYYHMIRARRVSPNTSILEAGSKNGIISMGYYGRYIREWMDYFPREQFHFVVFEEDVIKNRAETIRSVFQFLSVDDSFEPQDIDSRRNARAGHLQMRVNYVSPRAAKLVFGVFPSLADADFGRISISEEEIQHLRELYAVENEGLGELIGRDVPWQSQKLPSKT